MQRLEQRHNNKWSGHGKVQIQICHHLLLLSFLLGLQDAEGEPVNKESEYITLLQSLQDVISLMCIVDENPRAIWQQYLCQTYCALHSSSGWLTVWGLLTFVVSRYAWHDIPILLWCCHHPPNKPAFEIQFFSRMFNLRIVCIITGHIAVATHVPPM